MFKTREATAKNTTFLRCWRLPSACALLLALGAAPALADDALKPDTLAIDGPAILPPAITLTHAKADQQLLVEMRRGGDWRGDLTDKAKFGSSKPEVITVDERGLVRAVADGEAVVWAEVEGPDGQQPTRAETRVTVRGTGQPFHWSFPLHVQPVLFKAGCNTGACHGAAAGKNGFKLSLRGYNHAADHAALTRQAAGRRVSIAEPAESLILLKATQQVKHGGGERFAKDSVEYNRLLDWIEAGTPDGAAEKRTIDRIEMFPKFATLALGSKQRVLARAVYSNGEVEDVTRWVKFGVTDDSVAIVDDAGVVEVKGPGAVAITAWYSSKVSFAQITVPRDAVVASDVFERAERHNFIDDQVLVQLRNLNIAPATLCSDSEFIRRAYLDATGTLPDAGLVLRFGLNPASDKRSKLIDSLLISDAFVDYWAYKWSDLLLISARKLPKRQEMLAFYNYVRESVKTNKPWDAFAREIVTATGGSVRNGATNYYVMHKEPIDLTETTAQTFLGMSITCARCHNHPLEKWTQDDYYGMANLFARVSLKNSSDGRETQALATEFGDVAHPRLGRPVPPKPLDGAALEPTDTRDRREALAQWMTAPENPYFTRAVVNRVWKNYMGRGLVEPEDDVRLTNPASNEALLAALADDLVRNHYDLRHLMREIMNSAAYQRSADPVDSQPPDMKYYSQYIVRRLSAETLLDAYSQVTGVATPFNGYPAGFRAMQLPDSSVASYFLTTFGRPERRQTCSCERTDAVSVAQTLHVANGDTLNQKLRDETSWLATLVEKDDADILDDLFLRALARRPNDEEKTNALPVLASVPREGDDWKVRRREAIEDLAWAALSGKEFTFNH